MKWLGIQSTAHNSEIAVSTLGGVVSICLIFATSYWLLGLEGSLAIVPSMGASAVLLFAVPHGPLSQPWALFAGHCISAIIGVTAAHLIPSMLIASGVAVGLAIGAMLLCRCTHPPGGASALAAVIGGDSIYQLGYSYVAVPVLLNCLIIFLVAISLNNLFPWRRYPASAMRFKPAEISARSYEPPQTAHLTKALEDMAIIDISASELRKILIHAEKIRINDLLTLFDFELGGVYTNNKPGRSWSVRKIIDHEANPNPDKELVIYKVLDGAHKGSTRSCTKAEFAQWAKQKLSSKNQS